MDNGFQRVVYIGACIDNGAIDSLHLPSGILHVIVKSPGFQYLDPSLSHEEDVKLLLPRGGFHSQTCIELPPTFIERNVVTVDDETKSTWVRQSEVRSQDVEYVIEGISSPDLMIIPPAPDLMNDVESDDIMRVLGQTQLLSSQFGQNMVMYSLLMRLQKADSKQSLPIHLFISGCGGHIPRAWSSQNLESKIDQKRDVNMSHTNSMAILSHLVDTDSKTETPNFTDISIELEHTLMDAITRGIGTHIERAAAFHMITTCYCDMRAQIHIFSDSRSVVRLMFTLPHIHHNHFELDIEFI